MRRDIFAPENHHANLLNVGLGVQSTSAALQIINGDLPAVDAFIFADTGWERQGTYENFERLKPLADKAGIPFHVVSGGNIRDNQLNPDYQRTELPYFCDPSRWETVAGKRNLLTKDVTKAHRKMLKDKKLNKKEQNLLFSDDDLPLEVYLEVALADFDRKVEAGYIVDGYMEMSVTQIGRQCTLKYKIKPVNKFCRKHYGAHFKTPVGTWLGISTDEWHRMSVSEVKAFVLYYPLIKYGLSRDDCEQYMIDHDYLVPVKSSCIGCPFHSDGLWKDMSDAEVADADAFEKGVNKILKNSPKLKDKPYFANGIRLHDSMEPIGTRPFVKGIKNPERDGVCGAAGCFL